MRRALAILLLVTVTPCAAELLEWGVHALGHGDYAHAADGRHDDGPGTDEHGCSTLFHTCGCHSSANVTAGATAASVTAISPPRVGYSEAPAEQNGRGDDPPPKRPPIA